MATAQINKLKLTLLAIALTFTCWTIVNIFIVEISLIMFLVMEFIIAVFQIFFNFVRHGVESTETSESEQEMAEEPEDENPLKPT